MPSFPAMLKKTLVDAYDCIQLLVFGNVAWCTAWLVPIAAMAVLMNQIGGERPPPMMHQVMISYIGLACGAFVVGPTTMGLAALARSVTTRQDPRLVDFFRGLRRFYVRGVGLFALNVAVTTMWAANAYFWSSSGPGGTRIGQLGSLAVVTLFSYAMLYWVLMQIYCPACIVREDIGVLRATRRSALLVLGNLSYSALIFLQLAIVAAIIALPVFVPVGILWGLSAMLVMFLAVAFAMLLGAAALEDLMRQYEDDDEPDGTGARKGEMDDKAQ